LQGYYIAILKPKKKAIFTSYWDNILNHKTKGFFFKYLFHAQYIMPYILIQVNEGITKKFTCMVKGHFNKIWSLNGINVSSWDICIHHET